MGYINAIEVLQNKCNQAKSKLYFFLGTENEFNENDGQNFPVVFLKKPFTSVKIKNSSNIIIQESFSFELNVLQTIKFTDTSGGNTNVEKQFENTNYILNALLNELLENDFVLTTGTARQVYKKTDLSAIGWAIPLTITIDIDSDLCCSFFE